MSIVGLSPTRLLSLGNSVSAQAQQEICTTFHSGSSVRKIFFVLGVWRVYFVWVAFGGFCLFVWILLVLFCCFWSFGFLVVVLLFSFDKWFERAPADELEPKEESKGKSFLSLPTFSRSAFQPPKRKWII